jgi:hypothetical protein
MRKKRNRITIIYGDNNTINVCECCPAEEQKKMGRLIFKDYNMTTNQTFVDKDDHVAKIVTVNQNGNVLSDVISNSRINSNDNPTALKAEVDANDPSLVHFQALIDGQATANVEILYTSTDVAAANKAKKTGQAATGKGVDDNISAVLAATIDVAATPVVKTGTLQFVS